MITCKRVALPQRPLPRKRGREQAVPESMMVES